MSRRVCGEPGCGTLTAAGQSRCCEHRRAKERTRLTSGQRGYGYAHQQARAAWEPTVLAGRARCRRCGHKLDPAQPWDLGHPDAWCSAPAGPECIPCNRSTRSRYTQ